MELDGCVEGQIDRSMCDSLETDLRAVVLSLHVQRGNVKLCVNDNTNLKGIYDLRK